METVSKIDQAVERIKSVIDEISLDVATSYTLADAIREGAKATEQAYNWGDGDNACALTAAALAAKARGYA